MSKSTKLRTPDPQMNISDSLPLLRNDIRKLSNGGLVKEAKAISETLERVERFLKRAGIIQAGQIQSIH